MKNDKSKNIGITPEEDISFSLRKCVAVLKQWHTYDNETIRAHLLIKYLYEREQIHRLITNFPSLHSYNKKILKIEKEIEEKTTKSIQEQALNLLSVKVLFSLLKEYIQNLKFYVDNESELVDSSETLSDIALNVITERDDFELILEGFEKLGWGSPKKIKELRQELHRFDKTFKEKFVLLPDFKKYLDSYRASFGMKKGGKYWWLDIKTVDEVAAEELKPVFENAHPVKRVYAPTKVCKQFDEHIIAGYVDMTLPEDLKRQFEKHLESCNYCLNQVLEVMQTKEVFAKAKLSTTKELNKILEEAEEKADLSRRTEGDVKTTVQLIRESKKGYANLRSTGTVKDLEINLEFIDYYEKMMEVTVLITDKKSGAGKKDIVVKLFEKGRRKPIVTEKTTKRGRVLLGKIEKEKKYIIKFSKNRKELERLTISPAVENEHT